MKKIVITILTVAITLMVIILSGNAPLAQITGVLSAHTLESNVSLSIEIADTANYDLRVEGPDGTQNLTGSANKYVNANSSLGHYKVYVQHLSSAVAQTSITVTVGSNRSTVVTKNSAVDGQWHLVYEFDATLESSISLSIQIADTANYDLKVAGPDGTQDLIGSANKYINTNSSVGHYQVYVQRLSPMATQTSITVTIGSTNNTIIVENLAVNEWHLVYEFDITVGLKVSPTSLSFNGTQGSNNLVAQILTISNSGTGVLTWTTSTTTSWLILSSTSGTAPSTVDVLANIAGLVAGTYTGQVTISSNEGSQIIDVTLNLNNLTPTLTSTPALTSTPTPTPNAKTFQVKRDGLSFNNFSYDESSLTDKVKWDMFKKTFPATQMELATGERRKGPLAYYNSSLYQGIGYGGNCAGFTGAALMRYLGLTETVEPSLLLTTSLAMTMPYAWPESSDVKDYIHRYI